MNKAIAIFKSFQEAEQAEENYYRNLTPMERVSLLEKIRKQYEQINYGTEQGFRRVYRIVKRK